MVEAVAAVSIRSNPSILELLRGLLNNNAGDRFVLLLVVDGVVDGVEGVVAFTGGVDTGGLLVLLVVLLVVVVVLLLVLLLLLLSRFCLDGSMIACLVLLLLLLLGMPMVAAFE